MKSAWLGLLSNFAILFLPVFAWAQFNVRTRIAAGSRQAAMLGAVLGIGAILSMLTPFELQPGVFVDARSAAVATAGFFGGPIGGAVAMALAAAFRVWLGGTGAIAGTAVILIAGSVGVLGRDMVATGLLRQRHVLLLGFMVAIAGALSILLLPQALWIPALSTVALPSAVVSMVATSVLGLLLIGEERRRDLIQQNEIYRAITESLPDSLNVKDLEGRFIVANPATAALMRAPNEGALIGRTDFDFYPAETASRFREEEAAVLAETQTAQFEQQVHHADGTSVWLSTLKVPLKDASGRVLALITHNRDITARKALEGRFARSQSLLSAALAYMADGIVMFDAECRLAFCNEQYRRFFAATADVRVPGATLREILRTSVARGEQEGVTPGEFDRWVTDVEASLRTGGDRLLRLSNGRWLSARTRPLREGGCLIVFTDITAQKEAQEALAANNRMLAKLAATDSLTGLANRRAFDDELARHLRAAQGGPPVGLLLIDLDRFKEFNDTYGHQAGDGCLAAVAACLRRVLVRAEDCAARYGGEELAAILPGSHEQGAREVAERFRQAVQQLAIPHRASPDRIVTVSIGVASTAAWPRAPTPDVLLRSADRALYDAKRSGRNQVRAISDVQETASAVGSGGG